MNCRLNKNNVMQQFNKAAHSYDSVAAMQRNIVDNLCLLMPAQIASQQQLIDLGCGTGYALQQLSKRYPSLEFSGVDIAPKMLEIAKQSAPQAQFLTADIENLPYPEHCFDMVFSSSAIQWCDLGLISAEIKRILRPDGHLYLSSFVQGTLANWRTIWMDQAAQQQQGFVAAQHITTRLQQLGFVDIKLKEQTLYQAYDSFNDAVKSIKQLGAGNATRSKHTGLMSKTRYLSIKQKVDRIIQDQGQLVLPYATVYITAKRGY